jgi:hypothetical protein
MVEAWVAVRERAGVMVEAWVAVRERAGVMVGAWLRCVSGRA